MIMEKEIIAVKKEIMLQVPNHMEFKSIITEVKDDLFWVGLPRLGGQVLMLQENQRLTIKIPIRRAIYNAETELKAIGGNYEKFYGLAKPLSFTKTQVRQFVRTCYSTHVKFSSGNHTAHTALVNFSAGGVMVFLVPELERILLYKNDIAANFQIDNISLSVKLRLSWRKSYDNIEYAGFEFIDILPGVQRMLATLAVKLCQS